jgi:hypothetical protein
MTVAPHPNNKRAAIPESALRELYVDRGRTLEQVADHFSMAPITVRRRLRDLGIPARPRGPRCDDVPGRCGAAWSPDVAYVVGLIATDGNLSRDGRHLAVSSKDVDLLQTVRRCLRLRASITPCSGSRCYHIQWSDRVFYDWLLTVGLMPAKSLRLGPLSIPDEYFADFVRGCIDGDGSIVTYVDRYNTFKKPSYVYTRLFVSVISASRSFLDWLRTTVTRLTTLIGSLTVRRIPKHHDIWCLKYAKRESLALLRWIYYASDVPSLARKRQIAAAFLVRRETPAARRGPGRPMVV